MSKYPQVERLFADLFADDIGQVGADKRKKIMEMTGATDATVSRWVGGDTRPRPAVWAGLAAVAGVDRKTVAAALDAPAGLEPSDIEARLDHLDAQIAHVIDVVAENRDNLLTLLETMRLLSRERREDAEAARQAAAGE